jgi:hypothetical protein
MDIETKVAEQARKWEQLHRLLQDPDIRSFLKREFSRNGKEQHEPKLNFLNNDIAARQERKRGDLMETVESICKEFPPHSSFQASEVLAKMKDRSFVFDSKSPDLSVKGAMRKLDEKHHKLKLTEEGSGRRPNRYSWVG